MNPDVPRELDAVIQRATARAPEDRYHSPAELAAELRAAVPRSDTGELSILVHHTEAIPILGQETVAVPKRDRTLNKRRRKRRRLVVLGLVLSLIGVAILTAQNNLAKEYVPRVVGQTQTDADAELTAAGFKVRTVFENHATVPQGNVITQDPDGGLVREGSIVTLVVSSGPVLVTIPSVVGKPFKDAERILKAEGLVVVRKDVFHDTVPERRVISQSPQADGITKQGSKVTLEVSKGLEPITIPNVVGDPRESAEADLRELGLEVRVITRNDDAVPEGNVIRIKPGVGEKVEKGSTVIISVSLGPPLTTVPNVFCKARRQAADMIISAGLKVKFDGDQAYVLDQSPAADSQVAEGTTVTLYTAPGNSC